MLVKEPQKGGLGPQCLVETTDRDNFRDLGLAGSVEDFLEIRLEVRGIQVSVGINEHYLSRAPS